MSKPKSHADLRQRVRFEARAEGGDGYGNAGGAWAPIDLSRRGSLSPTTGGEAIIAGRLAGRASWDLWLRFEQAIVDTITTSHRAVNDRTGEAFNIRFIGDLDGDRRWLFLQLEADAVESEEG